MISIFYSIIWRLIARHVSRQGELTAVATRIAKPFINIPEGQLEHHTGDKLFKTESQSEQAKALLEAGELFDRLSVEVSSACWS